MTVHAADATGDGSGPAVTDEQRVAIEWGEGPLMVLAGAGTGKTTVIVERLAWLLGQGGQAPSAARVEPENVLVLTYNVRAANELVGRVEHRLGPGIAARTWIHNFHSFGQRLLRETATDASLPAHAEVLDAIGQRLLLNELRAGLPLLYHQFGDLRGQLAHLADVVNRARDELATPADYRAHADRLRETFEATYDASYQATITELAVRGDLRTVREVRRALARGADEAERAADRVARRRFGGGNAVPAPWQLTAEQRATADGLRPTFLRDAAALEVLRIEEEAAVYGAYVDALHERGAVDFGEQILRAIRLLEERPNILRRYQAQFRHVLVDEFQDANVAQIMLLELIGRSPDRPDNVMVVGDDDQSIYRFRGASYAAFEQFERRFSTAPAWDIGRAAAPVPRTSLVLNRRSSARIVSASGRLIERNAGRLKSGPPRAALPGGQPVEIIVAGDEAEEAEAVVDAVRRAVSSLPDEIARGGGSRRPRWSDVAVLYRRHRHREAIARRLRDQEIPFVVVGGTGLLEHPDVRDVECALRSIANPDDSVSATRLLAAPPWRLDAGEILRLTRAAQFGRPGDSRPITVFEAARDALEHRHLMVEARPLDAMPIDDRAADAGSGPVQLALPSFEGAVDPGEPSAPGQRGAARRPRFEPAPLSDAARAKLQRLMDCTADLAGRAHRDGPCTVLEEYLARTELLRDLVATATPEAQRAVLALARFMRFVSDWQRAHPRRSLPDFVAYLDLFEEAGGDLEADPGGPDVDAVQLMTVHQAKGLEWQVVVIPRLAEGQFPDTRNDDPVIPPELLRQEPPADFREAEERRLCYVAMTRARSRLVMSAVDLPEGRQRPSRFLSEIAPCLADPEAPTIPDVMVTRRRSPGPAAPAEPSQDPAAAPFDRGFMLRRRAAELVGLLEHVAADDAAARDRLLAELVAVATDAAGAPDGPQGRGPAPLTLGSVAGDASAGARLIELVPAPDRFSHTAFTTYAECPLQYAFQRVYQVPVPEEERKGFFTFGSMVHEAFEAFGRAQQAARAAGLPDPGEADLEHFFEQAWQPVAFGDPVTAASYRARGPVILRNFYTRQLSRLADAVCFEQPFRLPILAPDGVLVSLSGAIDRIDRLPDGTLELIDYKTGRPRSQEQVDADPQLSTYALAMREGAVRDPATGEPLPPPARLTLYFTETDDWLSTTRSEEQLAAHREALVATIGRIRSGDFAATPDARRCERCDFRRLCPSRWGSV